MFRRKAQVLSNEAILAVFLFSMVLATVFFIWDTTSGNIWKAEVLHEMDSLSTDAVEKLVRTPGVPSDWQEESLDNISAIGLCAESRMFEGDKVARFVELMDSDSFDDLCGDASASNYECSRFLLGLKKYEFFFTLTDLDNNIIVLDDVNCSTGRPPVNESFLVTLHRSGVLDDEVVRVSFSVWV